MVERVIWISQGFDVSSHLLFLVLVVSTWYQSNDWAGLGSQMVVDWKQLVQHCESLDYKKSQLYVLIRITEKTVKRG